MVDATVVRYIDKIKEEWSEILAAYGYDNIEEDLTDDGRWHGDAKPLGRVAFWRNVGSDGIIVRHFKFYDTPAGPTMHGEEVYAVGFAYDYLKSLGYRAEEEQEKVRVNHKEFDAVVLDEVFDEFLYKTVGRTPLQSSQDPADSMSATD